MELKYPFIILLFGSLSACQFSNQSSISFNRDVRPILNEKCLGCHGGVKAMGQFSLLFEADAFQPTDSGKPAIVRGNHEKSELYKRLIHKDEELRMPFEALPLEQKEIDIIAQWIDEGAKWEKHWAYIPPEQHIQPPTIESTDWPKHEIDQFVIEKLYEKGLMPNVRADKSTLIRRVYLDLIGIPPTLEQAAAFLENDRPDAFEKVVDELLDSPHFGEHWAAMWLDLARYGDSQGYQKDNLRRQIWRYRDWVIHAFNEDLPFDQFTIEQLAGDLLPSPTDNQILATAFHRNTNTNSEGGTDNEEFRTYAVMDRLSTTFEIWQGMTMSCVQCHSHPYDPVRHEEYYHGLAFFNNTADADFDNDFPRKKLLSPGQQLAISQLQKELDQYRKSGDTLSKAYQQGVNQLAQIEPQSVPIMKELVGEDQRVTNIFERGNWLVKGKEVLPDVPHILSPLVVKNDANRLDLARWLVAAENPLTARVIVNRFWAALFGNGIVETLEDFGTQGAKPSNQRLLDWLAVKFRTDYQWSVKTLLKNVVLSATYQQATKVTEEKLVQDPYNQFLTRGPRFRLSAEQIRDQALTASGLLNRTIYGPSVMPYLPDGVYSVIRHIHKWETSPDGNDHRRGLYTFWRKTSPYPSMISFDVPSREFCVSRRVRTNTPLQAMITLNDPVYLEAAKALAERMNSPALSTLSEKISFGFEHLLFKKPNADQLQALTAFYEKSLANYQADEAALGELILNKEQQHPTFAAMINVANVLLNMDEVVMKG
ncbi:MAG: PSD1 and planctomycete cytochrome C domain-containing protein [Bacteroidota bacterium]